jgi:hypothetical protein
MTATLTVIHPSRPISVSQATTFASCPQRWFYDTAGYRRPQTAPQLQGIAVDEAISAALLTKMQGKQPDALTIGEFARERAAAAGLDKDESDTCAKCAAAYFAPDAPGAIMRPDLVHAPFNLQLPDGGPTVRGELDWATDTTVIDLKVQKQRSRPTAAIARHRLQLATYAIAFGRLNIELHSIVKTKRKPPAVLVARHTLAPVDVDYALSLYGAIHRAMLSQRYPAARESMYCSRRLCPHWEVCINENGGDVKP